MKVCAAVELTADLSSPNLIRIWRTWPVYIDWCKNRLADLCHWIVSSVSVSWLSQRRWDFVGKSKSCTTVWTMFLCWVYAIIICVDQLTCLLLCVEPELRRSLRWYPNKLDDEKLNWPGIHPQMLRDPIDIRSSHCTLCGCCQVYLSDGKICDPASHPQEILETTYWMHIPTRHGKFHVVPMEDVLEA